MGHPDDLLSPLRVPPAEHLEASGEDAGDGFGVGLMLLLENAVGESVGVVRGQDGDGSLEDDDAVVQLLIDKMDGAAGDLDAVVEGLLLRVEAGEGREQRGVDVEDAVGEGADEVRREQAHVAGEADELDVMLAESGDDVGIVLGALAAAGVEGEGGEAALAGGGEAGSVGHVRDDDSNAGVGDGARADRVGDGEEVGAAAGEEDTELVHGV